jgi:protein phosphatase
MESDEFTVQSYKLTDIGRKKANNEDWVDLFEPNDPSDLAASGRLYIVADGVGGGFMGEKASQYAAQKVLYEYYQQAEAEPGQRLKSAIEKANKDIFNHAEEKLSDLMGTTLVAAVIRGSELIVANVGDSRAYLIRGSQVEQITRDHSLVQKLLDDNQLTIEEARTFKRKNVILRSVGADSHVAADVFYVEIASGDTLLLCSDGLHKYFPDSSELGQIALSGSPESAAHCLVNRANERGGSDNISVVIARVGSSHTNAGSESSNIARKTNIFRPVWKRWLFVGLIVIALAVLAVGSLLVWRSTIVHGDNASTATPSVTYSPTSEMGQSIPTENTVTPYVSQTPDIQDGIATVIPLMSPSITPEVTSPESQN